ncbi:E3 SUMO-protein ligase RanBP2 [Anopheles darlingi]|uniref:E3 SUMO-protein ligase RanBP2 n=1 Tax=Anopheles darlingi TaxID=43151 RepID=UPI0020FFFE55|nr:E3 SUMO-protein ligase RanBP2 [Anopheles darlingi]
MFSKKRDLDRHIRTTVCKLSEYERCNRGLTIARQYFRMNEYGTAEHWVSCFLSLDGKNAQAYKLLGQCYEKQGRIERALTQYQRSLEIEPNQSALITDSCRLLLMDENWTKNLSMAKYWCDLAETQRINHEAVLNLKLKIASKEANSDQQQVKDIIVREILARPHDPALRVRLVEYFLEEKQLEEAFRYCFELEMKFSETFLMSIDWTNVMDRMLSKYAGDTSSQKQPSWHYYLLQAIVLDRQIYLSLLSDSTMETIKRSNMKEIASKLYELDQLLRLVAEKGKNASPHKQLADEYLRHYRGQLLLHSASLLFKGSADQGSSRVARGREMTKRCLALLLLAYQCGVPKTDAAWLKQSNESSRQVMTFWSKQAAFRCCQAGSTVLSCIDNNSLDVSVLAEIQNVTESKVWTTADNLLDQVRQLCTDPDWRKDVFRTLYPSGDSSTKAATSYFVQEQHTLSAPQYALPKHEHLEVYLELAQSLFPSSLPYLVYLGLAMGIDKLADLRCRAFPRLNFSTNNLDNCNLETLNQLDMDSFLYCSILVAHSNLLEGERQHYRAAIVGTEGRPAFLPAPNLLPLLCEENKVEWWSAAYHLIRSSTAKEAATTVAEQKQLLQHGLQAIRGTGAPLCDVMVLLKLGQILAKRSISGSAPPEERRQTECRAETVYRSAVLLWKHRNESGVAASSSGSMFFQYGIESYDCQQETVKLTEAGITFLAGVYFKHGRLLEFTQDFAGIPLPYAAFFRAEAFKKLDESNKTPMKGTGKKLYAEKARECIRLTQQYLTLPYIERNHTLKYVVQGELKRMSFGGNDSFDATLNASANGGDESDLFQSFTSTAAGSVGGLRSERETTAAVATAAANVCLSKTNELESLIRQMMETLTFVKEDVLGIRNDVGDMQDRLVKIEENIYRKPLEDTPKQSSSSNGGAARSTTTDGDQQQQQTQQAAVNAASAAAAWQAMNEIYLMDEFQNSAAAANAAYHQQVHASGGRAPAGIGLPPPPVLPYGALYGAGAGAYAGYLSPAVQQSQQQQQMLTPRGHTGLAGPAGLGVSPLHTYQHPDQNQQQMLLAAMNSPVAVPGVSGGYHPLPPTYQQQTLPVAVPSTTAIPQPSSATAKGTLSLEQSLQTPSVLNSWNNTYHGAAAFNSMPPVAAAPPPPPATAVHHVPADKGAAPVNVVITSSDPLPPRAGAAHNSTSFAAGASTVASTQPTYSVTIPPQHIKHSATGGSIGQGTTAASTPKLEAISPVVATGKTPFQQAAAPATSINSMKPSTLTSTTTAGSTVCTSSPSFFSSAINSPTVKALLTGGGGVGNDGDDGDDDEDDAKNLSGTAEYDPRPDFQPIIPLPDEIVVRTGEEDEEQMFSGRSKLLRLVDREWKERGLGELKILRSKADASKYRIVMRREQIHKICANHYITPELIIKPMDKRPECYIWAAMDFADEEPRKESFCARFGTADLAKQFFEAFITARDAVAKLRANDPVSSSTASTAAPPPTSVPTSFSFVASKPPAPSISASTAASATTKAPFGEFTFAKNYTPPKVATGTESSTAQSNQSAAASKPSPFASFTFKAQTAPPANTSEQPGSTVFGGGPGLGFDEKDYKCIYIVPIVGLKYKEQPQAKDWSDYGNVPASGATLRLLSGTVNGAPVVRVLIRKPGLLVAATVCLNQIFAKDTRVGAVEKTGASWTGAQDGAMATATTVKGQTYAAYFKSTEERDTFLAEIKKVLPGAVTVSGTAPAGPKTAATSGFGDLFKPKSGSWDCTGCYVNNKAEATHCLACNGPRDPSVKAADATKPKGGLFDNLAVTAGSGSKFTFGMPPSTGSSAQSTITFGVAPAEPAKVAASAAAKPAAPAAPAAGAGFGDKFKPKPGAWTCNACYLSNGADTVYCMSCESPKDDTVPKKSSASSATDSIGGLLKAADTMPKFNFTAGGGFSFGVPPPASSTASTAGATAATTTTSTAASSQPAAAPVFGGGFSFGSPMKPPATIGEPTATTVGAPSKQVFKFELPIPTTGGLSFGSKLAPTQQQSQQGDAAKPLDAAPEKTSFGFVFKPKSPGRTHNNSTGGGAGDGGDDDAGGGAADSSVTEEENNTYFAPVIPLPDKVEVKTGEEDEHVLYAHRAKLYRFISSEWKERGIGDVKILKHKETGKMRVVMRREQVLKICLNHALTEEVCYSKKDDKSWQFVANDFSEGSFELMNFCLRFKSADVAQEFRDAITDALSGKLTPQASAATPTVATQSDSRDSTITSTTSPQGEFNFSKLSDVSLNERETLEKYKLPANFFDAPATGPCTGCRGCDPDVFEFPSYDCKSFADPGSDGGSLPLDISAVPALPERRSAPLATTTPKKVSFSEVKAPLPTTTKPPLFGGLTFGVPSSTSTNTSSTATNSFLAAEQKSASASTFLASSGSIFGGDKTVTPVAGGGTGGGLIFGSSQGGGIGSGASGGSIFSASLNTTPKTTFVSPPSSATESVSAVTTGATTTTASILKPPALATPLLQQPSLTTTPSVTTTPKAIEGGNLFGGSTFGSGGSTKSIFGSGGVTTTTPGGNVTATPPSNLFGSVSFGGASSSPNFSFGGISKLGGSLATTTTTTQPSGLGLFGGVSAGKPVGTTPAPDAAPVLKMDSDVSFADLASSSPSFGNFKKIDGGGGDVAIPGSQQKGTTGSPASGGFVGLTVKEDFFSRSAANKLNSSGGDGAATNNNGKADEDEGVGGDEHYDPYYAPVIQLPDEIEVRTGEEEETKVFGDRAKLFRYDSDTKEWKERGVGELKILHHPVRNAYRMLLRREQIFKLVLNHAITTDLAVTPMNNSGKAFVWAAMNHAEGPAALEKLAVRFKNETIAAEFLKALENCQEKLRTRPDLEPDQD